MKKLVSMLLVLAMLVTVFAGLAITASAADAVLTVYTQAGADGEKHRPVMIHRVVLGSIERFIGVITEHFAGAFPLWLAPEQVKILPISDKFHGYAEEVRQQLDMAGLRVSVDTRSEKIGYKIREAQLHKITYMLDIGEKEVESGTVSVRKRGEGDIGAMSIADFVDSAKTDVAEKAIW